MVFYKKKSTCYFCKLHKSIYRLRQSDRAWYTNINSFLQKQGPVRNTSNHNLYFFISPSSNYTILVLYVDNILLTDNNAMKLLFLMFSIEQHCKMSNQKNIQLYVAMQFVYLKHNIALLQSHYIKALFAKFGMVKCNPNNTPIEGLRPQNSTESNCANQEAYQCLVGSLIFYTNIQSNLAYFVGVFSRFITKSL